MIGGLLVTVSGISPPLGFLELLRVKFGHLKDCGGLANSVPRGLTVEIDRTLFSWTHSSQVLGAFQSADFFSQG
jgi:hypothetical protein